jgi:beta-phosphoglucomutase-like phosphatase (HAD superfamily)
VPRPDSGLLTAVLCDADGNLFASEGPAFEASADVTNRFLREIGAAGQHTADELRTLALGRNFRLLASGLARAQGLEVDAEVLARWVDEETTIVTAHLSSVLAPDPLARTALDRLARRLELSLVSSSSLTRLDACLVASALGDLFPRDRRFSAQDSLPFPTSKPDPAVYRHALATLGLPAQHAVAVEDAVAGVMSAVGAGIATIGNLVHVAPSERATQREALLDAGAFAVVESWDDVAALVLDEQEEVA